MKSIQENEYLLFPTAIWEYQYADAEAFNEKLSQDILAFDWELYKKSKGADFGDDLTSRSEDTFIPLDQAIGIMHVLQLAMEKAALAAERFGWDVKNFDLKLEQYWANVNAPNEYNMRHHHAPCHLSGVYYVRVPENSGNIRFFDDRRIKSVTEPSYDTDTDLSRDCFTFEPKPGMLLLFPSWLEHIVGQNKSDETRVSISFNIDLVAKSPQ